MSTNSHRHHRMHSYTVNLLLLDYLNSFSIVQLDSLQNKKQTTFLIDQYQKLSSTNSICMVLVTLYYIDNSLDIVNSDRRQHIEFQWRHHAYYLNTTLLWNYRQLIHQPSAISSPQLKQIKMSRCKKSF